MAWIGHLSQSFLGINSLFPCLKFPCDAVVVWTLSSFLRIIVPWELNRLLLCKITGGFSAYLAVINVHWADSYPNLSRIMAPEQPWLFWKWWSVILKLQFQYSVPGSDDRIWKPPLEDLLLTQALSLLSSVSGPPLFICEMGTLYTNIWSAVVITWDMIFEESRHYKHVKYSSVCLPSWSPLKRLRQPGSVIIFTQSGSQQCGSHSPRGEDTLENSMLHAASPTYPWSSLLRPWSSVYCYWSNGESNYLNRVLVD